MYVKVRGNKKETKTAKRSSSREVREPPP